jgi:membrane protein implicated in regulation of membrane protease activity
MVGKVAVVRTPVGQGKSGTIMVDGELWQAQIKAKDGEGLPPELETGCKVKIVAQEGLKLLVEPLPETEKSGWD